MEGHEHILPDGCDNRSQAVGAPTRSCPRPGNALRGAPSATVWRSSTWRGPRTTSPRIRHW